MHRIDNTTATPALPIPSQVGQPGYFTNGDPVIGAAATVVDDDWMNSVQEEISYVIETSGLVLSKTDRTQLMQALSRLTRLRLNGNTTFYVSPSGNDNNSGLSAATPWASLNHAYNWIRDRIDLNGYTVTVQLAHGTYSPMAAVYPCVGPTVRFIGEPTDPSLVTVYNPSGVAIYAQSSANLYLEGMTLRAAGAAGAYVPGGGGIDAVQASVLINNIHFDVCSEFHMQADVGGFVGMSGNLLPYQIIGGAHVHSVAKRGSAVTLTNAQVLILNNPLFDVAFAYGINAATVDCVGYTATGTARGPRYRVDAAGVVQTLTGNPNFLPGDAAGINNGGYYN
jgi:hypothetical protein